MNEREMALKKIGMLKFALVDIDLFLDTHPGDTEVLRLRDEYERQLRPLEETFEKKFGPLTKSENDTNTWTWVKDPWPWDTEA